MQATAEIDAHQLAARRVASFGLPGLSPPRTEVADGSLDGFLARISDQRLTGLALAATVAGALDLPERGYVALLERHRDAMRWCLRVEKKLLSVADLFDAAGIRFLAIKGPAVAHTLYPDPSWRGFADLDLLIAEPDWDRVRQVLDEAGDTRRARPEPRPGFFDRFFGTDAVHQGPDGVEIDLHRTLIAGPFGMWMDPKELFRTAAAFRIGGRSIRRLGDDAVFLHACVNGALGDRPPKLMSLRDVAQSIHRFDLDWDLLSDWAARWDVGVVIAHALRSASAALTFPIPPQAQSVIPARPSRRAQGALASYTTERVHRAGIARSTVRAIPGLRAKASYLWSVVFPDEAFMRERTGVGERPTRLRYWTRAFRRIRGVPR